MTEERNPAGGEDTSWLAQYYTNSKISGDLEAPLPADGPGPIDLLAAPAGAKYDFTGQVGLGGMKIVHRARDRNADRDVALAMLQKHAPRSSQERRFLREARLTAALEHPNIVPVHEIGLDSDSRPYFTMKLLGGENLHDILGRVAADTAYGKQYPLGRLLEIFLNVCQAIAFAHSRGVVHLDLKPANIQVGSFGEVLVLDWGLAKLLDATGGPTPPVQLPEILREAPVEGVVRGTPGYMAPEQAQGDFRALDQRTDVFALGAVLKAISHSQPAPRRVPPALEAIVAKAMAREAGDRYPSVTDLAGDVRAFLGGYAVSAQSVGVGTLFWLLVKRHKAVATVVVASVVTIATLLAVFIVKIKQSERQALDTLAQLTAEQAEKVRIGRYATPQLLTHAQELVRGFQYDEALAELNLILIFDSNMAQAWLRKGFLHLGRLEFDEAVRIFDRVPATARRAKRDPILRPGEMAEKYQQLTPATGVMGYAVLQQFITDLTSKTNNFTAEFQEMALGQLFQQLNRTRTITGSHLEFVGAAIGALNPPATNVVCSFQIDEAGLTVTIKGERVTQLAPLNGLRLYALEMAGTAVVDLRWLRDSGLHVLDLTGTPVKELAPLFSLPLTQLRIVNCPNIRLDQLRNLARLEKVVVSPPLVPNVEKILSQSRPTPEVVSQ